MSKLSKWLDDLTPGTKLPYRAWCKVIYKPKGSSDETDISEEISKYLISIDYTDNMVGQVDDITLTLEDRAQLWTGSWWPQRGAKISVTLYTYNRNSLEEGQKSLRLGEFEIDEIELRMSPAVVQIKAVSATFTGSLRGEKKNRTWEQVTVKKCVEDIAEANDMTVDWYCEDDPDLDHVEQSDESDLSFLEKVVKDAGFCLKVDDGKIIIFDEQKLEEGTPQIKFIHPGTATLTKAAQQDEELPHVVFKFTSYSLKAKTRDVYKTCHVSYRKGKNKETIEGSFTAPDKKDGQTLEVSEQCDNVKAAERLARKRLREQNKDEMTASFSTYGDLIYAAGELVQLEKFGVFDGKYIITKVSMRFGGGFTADIDMRRCLNGY